ncbi:MAG: DDE-type integrase/transposase/recombinase [Nanoarchaeota archaeon]|nr:DDE-type integrase/transposase/recombinase [Nanoarchaeota archaeon]
MKKEKIRFEYFKLKNKGHSYSQCKIILKAKFDYEVSRKTLIRWSKKLKTTEWDLRDKSRKPKTIHYKITSEIENKIINLRNKTGFGAKKLATYVDISHQSVNKILIKYNLTDPPKRRKNRKKYIRWQRKHVNSLWQMDLSEKKIEDQYCFSVMDDCSRYRVYADGLKQISTDIITHILDKLIKKYGKPREILTDNGSVFGSKSKHSRFDRWCRRRGIKHIRTQVHSPTTQGKIERGFGSLAREIKYCKGDIELCRYRYNHFRPHESLDMKTPGEIFNDLSKLY